MLKNKIAYSEALSLILDNVQPGQAEEVELSGLNGRILSEDITALVDSPSLDVSLKDGYALLSQDVNPADSASPVVLSLAGFQAAGDHSGQALKPGSCVRVTTGAPLPPKADAVLANEFTREEDGRVWCLNIAEPGRNVLPRGTDIRAGDVIVRQGERLGPALIGLLAAAGLDRAPVVALPRVAVLGTGDEVVAPGRSLPQGKLYASNIVETMAWLRAFGLAEPASLVVPDRVGEITGAIQEMLGRADAFVTSGGAWKSERDLMLRVLEGPASPSLP
ncbi:MAG: molybdopterin molybdotransferase MoeA, partial [Thermodesulfobacteriota bacterium]|nr:molybdopterin molybdotransferase MoeA [Thermodesulfobacteriota bacterium]